MEIFVWWQFHRNYLTFQLFLWKWFTYAVLGLKHRCVLIIDILLLRASNYSSFFYYISLLILFLKCRHQKLKLTCLIVLQAFRNAHTKLIPHSCINATALFDSNLNIIVVINYMQQSCNNSELKVHSGFSAISLYFYRFAL